MEGHLDRDDSLLRHLATHHLRIDKLWEVQRPDDLLPIQLILADLRQIQNNMNDCGQLV